MNLVNFEKPQCVGNYEKFTNIEKEIANIEKIIRELEKELKEIEWVRVWKTLTLGLVYKKWKIK